jgi:hypothetical protein
MLNVCDNDRPLSVGLHHKQQKQREVHVVSSSSCVDAVSPVYPSLAASRSRIINEPPSTRTCKACGFLFTRRSALLAHLTNVVCVS